MKLIRGVWICTLAFALTACVYRAPGEDDLCTAPLINNPALTGDSGNDSAMPGGLYR